MSTERERERKKISVNNGQYIIGENFGKKKIWVIKMSRKFVLAIFYFGPIRFVCVVLLLTKFESEFLFGQKIFGSQILLGKKKWVKHFFGPQNNWVGHFLGPKKIESDIVLGPIKLDRNFFG